MSTTKAFSIAAALALGAAAISTAALAQPARFTDAQYIAASRCEALMASPVLGRQDTRGIDQVLKIQSSARTSTVFDRADQAKEDAMQAVRHGGAYAKAALIAERDGACQTLTGAGTVASAAPTGVIHSN
jgi:aconitase B